MDDIFKLFDEGDEDFIDWIGDMLIEGEFDVIKKTILNKTFNITFKTDSDIGYDEDGNKWHDRNDPMPDNMSVIDNLLDNYEG